MVSGFDLAEGVLVPNLLESELGFVVETACDFGRKDQRAYFIFKAAEDQGSRVGIGHAIHPIVCLQEVSCQRPQTRRVC